MTHAKQVIGPWLILGLALAGCGGSCRPAGGPPPAGQMTRAVGEEIRPTPPAVQPQTTVAAVASPQEGPSPAPDLRGDCFIFVDAEPDYGDAPLTAHFTTELECANKPVTYSWDFGDGTTGGNEPNPSHTYSKEGDYVATVTVRTADGEEGTDEIDIFVEEPADD